MTELYFGVSDDFEDKEFQNRRVIDEIEMVMSAFDCVLADDSGIYCSSDITTGKRFYFEVFNKYDVRSEEELKDKLGEAEYGKVKKDFIVESIERGKVFTEKLRERGEVNLLNPGPFKGPKFSQQHYHYLRELVIIKKIYQVYFNEDWQYSNGCTLEFAIAMKKGIPRFDHMGNPLDLAQGIAMIERALAELKERSIFVKKLEQNLDLIKRLQ